MAVCNGWQAKSCSPNRDFLCHDSIEIFAMKRHQNYLKRFRAEHVTKIKLNLGKKIIDITCNHHNEGGSRHEIVLVFIVLSSHEIQHKSEAGKFYAIKIVSGLRTFCPEIMGRKLCWRCTGLNSCPASTRRRDLLGEITQSKHLLVFLILTR